MRIVLVRPTYQGNLGAIARVMKNFGFTELALVKPRANRRGFTAKLYAKHSEEVLKNAREYGTLKEATKGYFTVGTTGVVNRFKLKKCVSVKKLPALPEKTAVVFGSEGMGLTEEELWQCDLIASIPTSSEHHVLNLSHAVGVICFELYSRKAQPGFFDDATFSQKEILRKMFEKTLAGLDYVRDKPLVLKAFKNVVGRSRISGDESQALMAFLAGCLKKVKISSRK